MSAYCEKCCTDREHVCGVGKVDGVLVYFPIYPGVDYGQPEPIEEGDQ